MGVYFYIINLSKRQYIDPGVFLDVEKIQFFLVGRHAKALAMLVCDSTRLGLESPAGSWSQDHVVVVGDASEPNEFGIQTATPEDPSRNLFMVAWQEFENISYKAIAMVCDWDHKFADGLAEAVVKSPRLAGGGLDMLGLCELGNAVGATQSFPLEESLRQHVGEDWKEKYEEARRLYSDWPPPT